MPRSSRYHQLSSADELPATLQRSPEEAQAAFRQALADAVRAYGLGDQAHRAAYAAPCVSGEADVLGEDDHAVEHALDMQAVHTHLGDLPEREQRALNLRFYGNLTQAEIGQRLGVSQMHVSRLLARSLALSPRSAEQRARQ